MNDYMNVANNKIFYVCGGIITIFVLFQAWLFFRHAFKEGLKCGLNRAAMYKALRTGFLSSIVPSIASVVALVAMVPVLGLPIPWIRQTIMGSTPYELLAAGIGAKTMGVSSLGGSGYTSAVFSSSIWIMTLGSVWAIVILVFFLKIIKKRYAKMTSKDPQWNGVLINAAFMGVFSVFIAEPVTQGGVPLATLLAGAAIMTVFAVVIVKFKQNWLKEYALTFSMIGAMICSVFITNLF